MNEKKVVIGFRVTPEEIEELETKAREAGFSSKTEYLQSLVKVKPTNSPAPTPDNGNQEPEPEETQEQEIILKLNPVQAFALRETVLNPQFIKLSNQLVNKIDAGGRSDMFTDLYSGAYKGALSELVPEFNENQAINANMAKALVNLFMAHLLFGTVDLDTPVTKKMIKEYLQDQQGSPAEETQLY